MDNKYRADEKRKKKVEIENEKLETESKLKGQQAQMGKDDGGEKTGEKLEKGKKYMNKNQERGRKRGLKGKG
jgi:hypothetical protein